MKKILGVLVSALYWCLLAQAATAQDYRILYNFAGSPADDSPQPFGNFAQNGDMLYGATERGGTAAKGTIFSIKTDGSNYTTLHNFTGSPDGISPYGSPILIGNKLYGTTNSGGSHGAPPNGDGILFSFDLQTSTLAKLHDFGASATDGVGSSGRLLLQQNIFYGITGSGGTKDKGTIFSYDLGSSTYAKRYDFQGVPDGASPAAGLISDGTLFYGTTRDGGVNGGVPGFGTIFTFNPATSAYSKIYDFTGSPDSGESPEGELLLHDGRLYGATGEGGAGWAGANYDGTVYSLKTDGTDFRILHSFVSSPYDGALPSGGLILNGSALYGLTYFGGHPGWVSGAYGYGVIYSIGTDGSDFSILHAFAGPLGDGSNPGDKLLLSGNTLYGATLSGGNTGIGDGFGTIFSYSFPTPTPTPTPLITLHVNKTTFSTTDQITVTADVSKTATAFYPFIRLTHPNGTSLYYVRGKGFSSAKRSFLQSGPFVLRNAIHSYPIINVSFARIQAGTYVLEGWGADVFGEVIDFADRHNLAVHAP